MKKIAVLTRDCAGVNAAIRSVVRSATFRGLDVVGVMRGYDGLMDNHLIPLDQQAVSGIISRGGTILKTARARRFTTVEGQKKALETIRKNHLDGMIVIGGNGSLTGAHVLAGTYGFPVVGIPATIDNDVNGVDMTIGTDTAINVALDSIDKIRDTVTSLERIYVVEVMGRECGYLALHVAIAGGCEEVMIPEQKSDIKAMCDEISAGEAKGKGSWIVVVAEGIAKAHEVAKEITDRTGLETRSVVLGHVQRGGSPTAFDRMLAAHLGDFAVETLLAGKTDCCVGRKDSTLITIPLSEAIKGKTFDVAGAYRLIQILSQRVQK